MVKKEKENLSITKLALWLSLEAQSKQSANYETNYENWETFYPNPRWILGANRRESESSGYPIQEYP